MRTKQIERYYEVYFVDSSGMPTTYRFTKLSWAATRLAIERKRYDFSYGYLRRVEIIRTVETVGANGRPIQ